MTFTDWKCPKCGREIRVDNSLESCYCNACGVKIPVASSTTANHATSTGNAKKNPWVGGTCPYCGKDVYALEEKRIPCPYCNKPIDAKIITQKKSTKGISGKTATESMQSTSSNRPSIGKAIGFAFLCYVISAALTALASLFASQLFGYPAYIRPSLISMAVGILCGIIYKTTGDASSSVVFSVLIGIALGLFLPFIAVYMH